MKIDKILIATNNPKKRREIEAIVRPLGVGLSTRRDVKDIGEIEEDGETFEENASKKALHCAQKTGMVSLADDSGLEVDALGGAPGVYSARYAGGDADDRENNRKLLRALENTDDDARTARFRCVIALAAPDGRGGAKLLVTTEGSCEGRILRAARGENGFGYDPVFYYAPLRRTFAELSMEEKASVSHRGKALERFSRRLRELLADG